ncbi:MAG: DUF4185 domain-containing protein [Ignavibacteriales bacterium]
MLKIKSIRDLGIQFANNPHKMVGQDGAYSIPLNDNSLLWFFGDTIIGRRIPGESLWYPGGIAVGPKDMTGRGGTEKMINNTGLISRNITGAAGIDDYKYILNNSGSLKQLIPLNENEDPDRIRVWCLHGVEIGALVYLYFIKVETIEEGIFPVNFKIMGSGLAYGNTKDWNFKRVYFNSSDLLWKADQPHFASAVLNPEGEYVYLYGVLQGDDKIQRCYLSRVKKDQISEPDKYEYLSGNSPDWSKSVDDAIPVFDGMPNEQSVSFNKYLGKYLAVHSFDLSGKIVARTSDTPWGPWSGMEELWQVRVNSHEELPYPRLIYAGKEHPAISGGNGKTIYVTYIEFEEYYPHLIEVNFE